MVRRPAHGDRLVRAGRGLDQLDAGEQAARLVLPAAARRHQLFQKQRPRHQRLRVPAQPAELAQDAQQRRRQQAAGAQAGPLGRGGQQGQFDAAAHARKLRGQGRSAAVRVEAGQEPGQGQGGFGERKVAGRAGQTCPVPHRSRCAAPAPGQSSAGPVGAGRWAGRRPARAAGR